ncbi:MAG: hypothetical protein JW957_05525 [Candidatus Omnitrophica bacterium]|nr:hypothetical protein [Candidatus Omnitrophota bacterium]
MRYILFCLASLSLIISPGIINPEETKKESRIATPVTYFNDFEERCDMKAGATNISKYDINSLEVSEEKANSGKKSLKLAFSVPDDAEGHYFYWNIPTSNIPLRNPTYLSAFVWGTEAGGYLGVQFHAPGVNKTSQATLTKDASFGTWQKGWREVKVNVYPNIEAFCKKNNWDMEGVVINAAFAVFSFSPQKLPFRATVFLDDVCVDYIEHNREAQGRPTEELYRIVREKMEKVRIDLNTLLSAEKNEEAETEAGKLWEQMESIGAILANTSDIPPEKLADMRITLDNLPSKYSEVVLKLEQEQLLK